MWVVSFFRILLRLPRRRFFEPFGKNISPIDVGWPKKGAILTWAIIVGSARGRLVDEPCCKDCCAQSNQHLPEDCACNNFRAKRGKSGGLIASLYFQSTFGMDSGLVPRPLARPMRVAVVYPVRRQAVPSKPARHHAYCVVRDRNARGLSDDARDAATEAKLRFPAHPRLRLVVFSVCVFGF